MGENSEPILRPNPYAATNTIPPGQTPTAEEPAEATIFDAADIDAGRAPVPWEMPGPWGRKFLQTVVLLYRSPNTFFKQLPRRGSIALPLMFDLVATLLTAVVGLSLRPATGSAGFAEALDGLKVMVLTLVGAALGMAITALLAMSAHLFLTLTGPTFGWMATFRGMAYASGGAGLMSIIPVIGDGIAPFAIIMFSILAIRNLQSTSYLRAIAAGIIAFVAAVSAVIITAAIVWLVTGSDAFFDYL